MKKQWCEGSDTSVRKQSTLYSRGTSESHIHGSDGDAIEDLLLYHTEWI